MLYISRCAGVDKWGVTDSEDGVEQVVNNSYLVKARQLGIEIEGVEYSCYPVNGRNVYYVSRCTVYQPGLGAAGKAAKALVLKGVDVKLNGDKIVTIDWNQKILGKNGKVRVSDFGTQCENFMFSHCHNPLPNTSITIIMDDKLKIRPKAFSRFFAHYGLVLDLRELSDDKYAGYAYNEYICVYNGNIEMLPLKILDMQDRMDLWTAIDIVYHGTKNRSEFSDEINAKVADKFTVEFVKLSKIELILSTEAYDLENAMHYCRRVARNADFWYSKHQDFDIVITCDEGIFPFIQNSCKSNFFAWSRFRNFIMAFPPNEHIKKAYVELCNRVNNWILDEGLNRGWIRLEDVT